MVGLPPLIPCGWDVECPQDRLTCSDTQARRRERGTGTAANGSTPIPPHAHRWKPPPRTEGRIAHSLAGGRKVRSKPQLSTGTKTIEVFWPRMVRRHTLYGNRNQQCRHPQITLGTVQSKLRVSPHDGERHLRAVLLEPRGRRLIVPSVHFPRLADSVLVHAPPARAHEAAHGSKSTKVRDRSWR